MMRKVVPEPVSVPDNVTLILCDANAKELAMIALPFGVVAPAAAATNIVGRLRAMTARKVLPIIAFPPERAMYDDEPTVEHGESVCHCNVPDLRTQNMARHSDVVNRCDKPIDVVGESQASRRGR